MLYSNIWLIYGLYVAHMWPLHHGSSKLEAQLKEMATPRMPRRSATRWGRGAIQRRFLEAPMMRFCDFLITHTHTDIYIYINDYDYDCYILYIMVGLVLNVVVLLLFTTLTMYIYIYVYTLWRRHMFISHNLGRWRSRQQGPLRTSKTCLAEKDSTVVCHNGGDIFMVSDKHTT